MKDTSKFQLIVAGVFLLLGLAAVAVFALQSANSQSQAVPVTIWGVLPKSEVSSALAELQTANSKTFSVTYTFVDEQSFRSTLVDALARGQGPDAVLISQDIFPSLKDLLSPVPYANYSQGLFENSFAQASDVYLAPDGVYALPLAIDPLVMYWNQTILSNAGYSEPPQTWTNVLLMAQTLTTKSSTGAITQSALDLGGWANIPYAKSMLASLMLQGGSPITSIDATGNLVSALNTTSSTGVSPATEALLFYTQFADPSKNIYSWNNALPSADQMFVNGNLGLYFAPASGAATLRSRNPNLDFNVASLPQTDTANRATFADVYAFSLVKNSTHLGPAFSDIALITGPTPAGEIVSAAGMAPARRDLLSEIPSDPYQAVSWQNALIAETWLDPDSQSTDAIFESMIESVTSGASDVNTAVTTANSSLQSLLAQ